MARFPLVGYRVDVRFTPGREHSTLLDGAAPIARRGCLLLYKCDGCREMLRLTMGVDVASIDAIMPDLVHGIGYTPTDTAQ